MSEFSTGPTSQEPIWTREHGASVRKQLISNMEFKLQLPTLQDRPARDICVLPSGTLVEAAAGPIYAKPEDLDNFDLVDLIPGMRMTLVSVISGSQRLSNGLPLREMKVSIWDGSKTFEEMYYPGSDDSLLALEPGHALLDRYISQCLEITAFDRENSRDAMRSFLQGLGGS